MQFLLPARLRGSVIGGVEPEEFGIRERLQVLNAVGFERDIAPADDDYRKPWRVPGEAGESE